MSENNQLLNLGLKEFVSRGICLNDRGSKVTWSPVLEVMEALQKPETRQVSVCSPRRSGKSQAAAAVAFWWAATRPHSLVVWVAGTLGSVLPIFRQKLATSTLANRLGRLGVEVTHTTMRFPRVNSEILCVSPAEANMVGKTVSLLLLDECRLIPEQSVHLLLPSVFGIGKVLAIGSAGKPRTWWAECFAPESRPGYVSKVFASSEEAGNPSLDIRAERDEARRRAERAGPWQVLLYKRDFESVFTELSDNPLVMPGDIDRASRDPREIEPFDARRDVVVIGADLSTTGKDLTSLAAVARSESGALRVLEARTFSPQDFPGGVPFALVEKTALRMVQRYDDARVCMDRHQGFQLAQRLRDAGVRVKDFQVTSSSNQESFGALAEALREGRLRWAKNRQLEREIAGLEVVETVGGFTVRDSDKRYHRDLSFSVATAVRALEDERPFRAEPNYDQGPTGVVSPAEKESVFWVGRHAQLTEDQQLQMFAAQGLYPREAERPPPPMLPGKGVTCWGDGRPPEILGEEDGGPAFSGGSRPRDP